MIVTLSDSEPAYTKRVPDKGIGTFYQTLTTPTGINGATVIGPAQLRPWNTLSEGPYWLDASFAPSLLPEPKPGKLLPVHSGLVHR